MANQRLSNAGLYLPTNFIWDINLLQDTKLDSPQFKELLVRLYQNINSMCLAINLKDSAYYTQEEFLNGQVFFPNPSANRGQRQAFRTTINFGQLPNNGVISIAHNINIGAPFSFTRIYGAASNQTGNSYIPLPYASSNGTDNIQLDVDATNVSITTTADYSAYTITYVVLEYLKN